MPSILLNYLACLFSLSFLTLSASAEIEQKLISINANNNKVTLTLFHFNASKQKVSELPVAGNIGSTIAKLNGKAGITSSPSSNLTFKNGTISFGEKANYLIKDGKNITSGSNSYGKHTFVLSNGKGSIVLGYAPMMTKNQLAYAIQNYTKSNKFNYKTAVLVATGNQCGFYADKGDYHEYYLKELNKAQKVIVVK